ncbi:TonB-dependent receptor [Agarilytica rhodophyticola]|uniref:TonB-dependent receptor n=1 Tax=Agarilytica rhodophyticola TaxID=1737490 RepID=UPI001319FB6E|nr:TonB-dependent receptor [Agarilytica rhodophyticola]
MNIVDRASSSKNLVIVKDKNYTYFLYSLYLCVFLLITNKIYAESHIQNRIDKITGKKSTIQLDIPAQSLDKAILVLSEKSNESITALPEYLQNKISHSISGKISVLRALELMLENTGLVYTITPGDIIVIRPPIINDLSEIYIKPTPTPRESEQLQEEEVLVRGSRNNSINNINFKQQFDKSVIDVVYTQDKGRSLATNPAEALTNAPGVSVSRSRGGSGRFISLRGISHSFNTVRYNGRLLATENRSRELSFDNFSNDSFSRMEVYKTSLTSLGDGSIGGQINLVPYKPFDEKPVQSKFLFEVSRNNLIQDNSVNSSGLTHGLFLNNSLGISAGFNYSKTNFRVDVAESIGTFTSDIYDMTNTGLVREGESPLQTWQARAEIDSQNNIINLPAEARLLGTAIHSSVNFGTFIEQHERTGGNLVFQFKPNRSFETTVDFLYSDFASPGMAYSSSHFPCTCNGDLTNIVVAENKVLSQYAWDGNTDFVSRGLESNTKTWQFGSNTQWQATSSLKLTADISYSKAYGRRDDTDHRSLEGNFFVIGSQTNTQQFYQHTGRVVPDVSIALAPYNSSLASADSTLPHIGADQTGRGLNPRSFGAHFMKVSFNKITDTVNTIKLDGSRSFNNNTSLELGLDHITRTKHVLVFDNSDRECLFCGYEYSIRGFSPQVFDSALVDFPAHNFLQDSGANVPADFIAFDTERFKDIFANIQQGDSVRDAEGNPTGNFHSFSEHSRIEELGIFTPLLREHLSNELTETINAIYLQLNTNGNWKNTSWNTNIGIRIADTRLQSVGAKLRPFTAAPNPSQRNTENLLPISDQHRYRNILPAFNTRFKFSENISFRIAASKTIARPDPLELSTVEITLFDGNSMFNRVRNTKLRPMRSTNTDLSLEWYGDVAHASAAIFIKDIKDVISDRILTDHLTKANTSPSINVRRPENLAAAKIGGVELAWQYVFESGLGYQMNYTYTDILSSNAMNTKQALENLSNNIYNLSVFYEKNHFYLGFHYNFREGFVRANRGRGGLVEVTDDYGQLGFSSKFSVTKNLDIYLEGDNITGENEFVFFQGMPNLLRYYEQRGAVYRVGFQWTL